MKFKTDGEKEILEYETTEGKRVYVRGLMYIMTMAINNIYPEARLTINYQLDNSMYCTFDKLEITEGLLNNIKGEMRKIVEADLEIKRVSMSYEEAKEFYEKEKKSRGSLQIDQGKKEEITLYFCGDYYNYLT